MKHLATIKTEFDKLARKWQDMPHEYQVAYIKRHPGTRRKVTNAPTPKSETSGLKIHEPARSQSHGILDTLRAQTDAESSKPERREYVTMREGSHNKYHYFAVFKDKTGNYVAANAYGRIGYPNVNVAIIGSSPDRSKAIDMMAEKMNKKMKKGYKDTPLPVEAPKVELSTPTAPESWTQNIDEELLNLPKKSQIHQSLIDLLRFSNHKLTSEDNAKVKEHVKQIKWLLRNYNESIA